MPFYEINYSKFGTALVEANSEDEAFEYLQQEVDYDEAKVGFTLQQCPERKSLYDIVSLDE